jgi:O-methyltransferase involved in polyketide biosynthesis
MARTLHELPAGRHPPETKGSSGEKVRLIILGAGYDLRGTRLLTEGAVDDVVELDLPEVVAAKQALWTQRLQKRRPDVKIPRFLPADLNDADAARALLARINNNEDRQQSVDEGDVWCTIYLAEGILVHLKTEAGHDLLKAMASSLPGPPSSPRTQSSYFLFADALPHVSNRNLDEARAELRGQGWKLLDFMANPTKAPHMGVAVLA